MHIGIHIRWQIFWDAFLFNEQKWLYFANDKLEKILLNIYTFLLFRYVFNSTLPHYVCYILLQQGIESSHYLEFFSSHCSRLKARAREYRWTAYLTISFKSGIKHFYPLLSLSSFFCTLSFCHLSPSPHFCLSAMCYLFLFFSNLSLCFFSNPVFLLSFCPSLTLSIQYTWFFSS